MQNFLLQELNETEYGILGSLSWMESVLKGDLRNFDTLQEQSKTRLQTLRDAALKEEQEYNEVVEAQVKILKLKMHLLCDICNTHLSR